MNIWDYEAIDWDDEEEDGSNLAHCLENDVDERVVDEVLGEDPVEINFHMTTAEIAIVGPDVGGEMWLLLFDWSYKRGDWLRPVTGRRAEPEEINQWRKAGGGT